MWHLNPLVLSIRGLILILILLAENSVNVGSSRMFMKWSFGNTCHLHLAYDKLRDGSYIYQISKVSLVSCGHTLKLALLSSI